MKEISPELVLVDPELAAEARASLPEPTPVVRAARVERPEPRPRRRRGRWVVAVALVGLLAAAAATAAGVLVQRADDEAGSQPRAGVLGAAKTIAPPPRSLPEPGRAPRVYAWSEAEGAAFYQVTFVRDGRTFYSAETRRPWLKVPNSLAFPPGRYRWSVRPARAGESGIALGDAILVRTFRVTRR